ncbi:MAG: GNAT family N-acetyltransferase [Gammaproteobacteria bacterium]|nr:GNAT family N-acetyltransferase [Gammaproteobacteria bacterium]
MQETNKATEFQIREAHKGDALVIADYNSRMAEETEGKSLDPDSIGPGVRGLLENATRGRYWVAEADDEIIGQLMITYEWSDWRNGTIWWIQSVYVPEQWRRKGVFTALYRHVESLAAAAPGVIGLRLYVEENNKRAQQTYEALGMIKPSYLVMESILNNGPKRR